MSTEQIINKADGVAIRIVDGVAWSIQFDPMSGAIIRASK